MTRIVFAGVGALGSNAVVSCRNLAVQFVLVDFDRVESKNCLSQAFVKPSVGKNKAEALKLQLSNFWGIKAESCPASPSSPSPTSAFRSIRMPVSCTPL